MTLYEYFNTTNQTSPHFERHENFVTSIHLTLPVADRCQYVRETPECHDNVYAFDYINLLYCKIIADNSYSMTFGVILLVLICLFMFILLATTADGFFCPSLKVLAKLLGLSENVAGVTLLAFGNGAPDFFTSLTGLSGESRRLFSDSFGAAMFIVFFVGGCIATLVPFAVQPASFTRDICFLLVDILLIDYVIKNDQKITIFEAVSILMLYVFYITCVLVDQYLLVRESKMDKMAGRIQAKKSTINDPVIELQHTWRRNSSISRRSTVSADLYKKRIEQNNRNTHLFMQFRNTLTPFRLEEWRSRNCLSRLVMLIQLPFLVLLTLFIPIVNIDLPFNGWSKLLNCMQIVLLPSAFVYRIFGFHVLFGVPIMLLVALAGLPIACLVFKYTITSEPPSGHEYFSIMGTIGSVLVVYSVATELNNVLDVIGITTNRSNSYLGCTLLGWGNGIGDLTADITLALQGYQLMGFAACFGGPLFNTLTVIGVALIYKCTTSDNLTIQLGEGTMGENSAYFMMMGLFLLLLSVLTTNFDIRRTNGLFMLFIYILYFAFCTMGELELIHPYGSDHRMDLIVEAADE